MRLYEILNEGVTDLVAHYYPDADPNEDNAMNPAVKTYHDENAKHYKRYFEDFYKTGQAPIINDKGDEDAESWTAKPKKHEIQSPGYRGREYAKSRAGQEYDQEVQPFAPRQRFDIEPI